MRQGQDNIYVFGSGLEFIASKVDHYNPSVYNFEISDKIASIYYYEYAFQTRINTSAAFAEYERYSTAIPQARILENYSETGSHTIGLYGSVGIEWFVAPKISLGADVNLCLLYTMTPNKYCKYEGYNIFTGEVENRNKLISPMDSYFEFSMRNIGANLFISFYF